ncbi:hypothetical protein J2W96_007900 [Variovorax guangxiensis]|nr:hypothetical protein [Variovorax guangxiensis]
MCHRFRAELSPKCGRQAQVLTEAERDSNAMMMVCVSGCAGERLVLDL